jgi:hypothetical protein
MSLSKLTDPDAVERAIKEFDMLGREAFLEKYGFGESRDYFILYRGGRYDSKAVIAAAYGIQNPDKGALTPADFSGGNSTVAKKLEKLGFQYTRPRKYVVFNSNPKKVYRVAEAVKHMEFDTWTVKGSDVRAGDRAIIWQTQDSTGKRGVVAFAEVLTDPEMGADSGNPYWVNPAQGDVPYPRVWVKYILPPGVPLWIDDSETGDFLKTLSVAKAQGGTVFYLTEAQWQRLSDLASFKPTSPEEMDAISAIRPSAKKGQGFGLTVAERRVVEQHAMDLAAQHLKLEWDDVEDVSHVCSFDLLCKRDSEVLRVEVKGTTNAGDSIILTENEISEAKEPGYLLFVVSDIILDRTNPAAPTARGADAGKFIR